MTEKVLLDSVSARTFRGLAFSAELSPEVRREVFFGRVAEERAVRAKAEAEAKAKAFESDPKYDEYATMMVKTHLSLTHDPNLKGTPKGWTLPVRDVLIYSGAKFLCPMAGTISLMPGTGSDPGFRRVDVDVNTGKVHGLHDVD